MTLDHRPQKIDAMNRLAWLYAKKRVKIERGIALIQTVMQANPNKAKYIDTFAELLFAKGDIVGAVKNINKTISIDPDNSYYKQQEWRFKNTSTQPLDTDEF
jgi:tetratricopeptide (TPR) repeat protein